MGSALMEDRGVVRISGADAVDFLQNLITCDVTVIAPGQAGFGALLTPQGKILFDFFIHRSEDGAFLFDLAAERVDAFIKRLGFYRLRAKVEIENLSATHAVLVGWDGAPAPGNAVIDPRLAALGWRAITLRENTTGDSTPAAYHAHRLSLFLPEGGKDFAYEETFPHEADMDQLNGVSFHKGCYVGQEIVSRMQHRSTARTRIVGATFEGNAPPPGTPITAGGKTIGKTGSHWENRLVAMVRIDKVADALAAGEPILAEDIPLTLLKPDWAGFAFAATNKD